MHLTKNITDNLLWVGANDRRLAMFEGVYSVPDGVSYNSYLLLDDKTVLFDTVDKAVQNRLMENLKEGLGGRPLDYLILQHIEPDHCYSVGAVIAKYPDVTLVLNEKSETFLKQFHEISPNVKIHIVKEGDSLVTGKHCLNFVMAPMVHWPEVMVTYDSTSRILFSADAFGCFGALNGAIFADEVDFRRDYLDEARRYFTNIVGKYGQQVQSVLKKASGLDIEMICPLHGFVWRKNFHEIMTPYMNWSSYEPEEQGVMIAYASVYGNTENAAEILSSRLRDIGIKTVMYDVSVTPASEIVAAAFKWSHLVFASTTYNAGIFVTMEALISDLVSHNIANRTVALIENGTWAATSGKLMRDKLSVCKGMSFIGDVSLASSVNRSKLDEINALALSIVETFPEYAKNETNTQSPAPPSIEASALWKVHYGLYLVAANEKGNDNACITNTVQQVTASPLQISVAINKDNLTHDMVLSSGKLAVSVLSNDAPFSIFEHFGLTSGRKSDKFKSMPHAWGQSISWLDNGCAVLNKHTNAILGGDVVSTIDLGTHSLFIVKLTYAKALSNDPSCSYEHYLKNIKPKPEPPQKGLVGFKCKICAYVYEGETIPDDFICPLCKHGVADFEKI